MYRGVARPILVLLISASVIRGYAQTSEPRLHITEANVELLRQRADLHAQRRHAWQVIAEVVDGAGDRVEPGFKSWHGESEVFNDSSNTQYARGIRGFSRTRSAGPGTLAQTADSPVLTYTLYNDAAFNHIRDNHLYSRRALERLKIQGIPDDRVPGNRDIPQFPREAVILKTAWWPISRHGISALPVWDSDENSSRQAGAGYLSWQRVVGVDPQAAAASSPVSLEFAGRSFQDVHRVSLSSFYYLQLDQDLAVRLMLDATARKQAAVVLGRPLQEGDYLILVGANLATRETRDWVWAALWWHDRPEAGLYADDRPFTLKSAWRNYLMQVAFDAITPVANDGGPHICFNPWLEGRFPDGGHGGGTASNCLACHARASYPPVSFLPVTRGTAQPSNDEAYLPGKLRTGFLWSIALHATP